MTTQQNTVNQTASGSSAHEHPTDSDGVFVMPRALSVGQLRSAAHALGFTLDTTISPATDTSGDTHEWPGDATLPLAVLDALIVRWQLDQDLRHPLDQSSRRLIAEYAQAVVADDAGDVLAAALRRVQTVAGLVAGPATDGQGPSHPGQAVQGLVAAISMLLAAWITSYALDEPALHGGDAAGVLTEQTVRELATHAEQKLAAAADAIRAWRESGGLL